MKNSMFGKLVSISAVCLFASTSAHAGTAIWQGGATGDINNPNNWNDGADITTDWLNFGQDVTATMSVDTAVFDPFGNKKSDADYADRNIVFNMGGHTMRATSADSAGKQYIVEVIAKPLFDSRVERVERVDLVKGVFWSERNAA